jgi:hypothetical protein
MDELWRIELLGWLRATHRDRVVSRFQTQKTGALLGFLAYHNLGGDVPQSQSQQSPFLARCKRV